jgi:hypothetical protein
VIGLAKDPFLTYPPNVESLIVLDMGREHMTIALTLEVTVVVGAGHLSPLMVKSGILATGNVGDLCLLPCRVRLLAEKGVVQEVKMAHNFGKARLFGEKAGLRMVRGRLGENTMNAHHKKESSLPRNSTISGDRR